MAGRPRASVSWSESGGPSVVVREWSERGQSAVRVRSERGGQRVVREWSECGQSVVRVWSECVQSVLREGGQRVAPSKTSEPRHHHDGRRPVVVSLLYLARVVREEEPRLALVPVRVSGEEEVETATTTTAGTTGTTTRLSLASEERTLTLLLSRLDHERVYQVRLALSRQGGRSSSSSSSFSSRRGVAVRCGWVGSGQVGSGSGRWGGKRATDHHAHARTPTRARVAKRTGPPAAAVA